MIDPNFTASQGAQVDELVRKVARLRAALEKARPYVERHLVGIEADGAGKVLNDIREALK